MPGIFPFCETRTMGEMLAFYTEEQRDAMLTYVIDLYTDYLTTRPTAVSLDRGHLHKSGHYALARKDPANHNQPKERQLDFFGGLRWRYEEHISKASRKVDRIALFMGKHDCHCATATRSTTRNTTPMPALGTTS